MDMSSSQATLETIDETTGETIGETVCTFTVERRHAGLRLDAFLGAQLEAKDVSREKIKKAIRDGCCQIGGLACLKPNSKLKVDQNVCIAFRQASIAAALLEQVQLADTHPLPLVYQDEWLAVIDKPAGLTVHPCPSCSEETLVHRLLAHFPQLGASKMTGQEGLRPGIVHRLDKDTSGLMVVALSEEARLRLVEAFAERQVRKAYWALVKGVPATAQGVVDAPIGRHPTLKTRMAVDEHGKPAQSTWDVCYADPDRRFSLLQVGIHTGRTHQIRVHMAHIGHPLYGDKVYGRSTAAKVNRVFPQVDVPRQMLHSGLLAFTHPFTQATVCLTSAPPEDMFATALALHRGLRQVIVTGGAGTGKSAVLDLFEHQGVPTWRADEAVARQYQPGAEAWNVLRQRYGDRFIPHDKAPVDKQRLTAALMEDPDFKSELEAVVHRLVRYELEQFWKQSAQGLHPFAVAEIPLWFENGWADQYAASDPRRPLVIGIDCDQTIRYQRLSNLRGWSAQKMAAVDAWQWPMAAKLSRCDEVIKNNGTLDDLQQRALETLAALHARFATSDADFRQIWDQHIASLQNVSCETR